MANKVYPRSCQTVKGKISTQTLHRIVCGIRRFIEEKKEKLDFNPPDASDKRRSGVALCSTCHYLFWYFECHDDFCGFSNFRRVLGAQIHVSVLRYEYVNKETFYSWVWNLFQALVVFNSFFIGFLNSSTWPEWGVLGG